LAVRWKKTKTITCKIRTNLNDSSRFYSTTHCYNLPHPQCKNTRNFCEFTNAVVNFNKRFAPQTDYGAIRLSCEPVPNSADKNSFSTNALNAINSMEMGDWGGFDQNKDFDFIIEEPVLLLIRDAFPHNLFHTFADMFHFFVQSNVLGLKHYEVKIILLDDLEEKRFVKEIWDLVGKGHILRRKDFRDKKVLLKRAFFLTNSWCSVTWTGDIVNHCNNYGYWVKLFANYFLKHNNFPELSTENLSKPKITILSRNHKRRISNERELTEKLRKKANGKLNIEIIDSEDYVFNSQAEIARNTNIMISTHGAGLTLMLFMIRGSAVVEIFPYNYNCRVQQCNLYHNLAAEAGLNYFSWFNKKPQNNIEQNGDWFNADTKIDFEDFIVIINNALSTLGHYNIIL